MTTLDKEYLRTLLRHRSDISHKGDYGHLLLVCGCSVMPGAAVLSTGSALKSGCGLVTLHSVAQAAQAAVSRYPSAMLSVEEGTMVTDFPEDLGRYTAIAAGPGLGRDPRTAVALGRLMAEAKRRGIPMLLDADALNIIASKPEFLDIVPEGSVMTPHLGELRRLTGETDLTGGKKSETIWKLVERSGCTVVSKGFHTEIYVPGGEMYVNTTGNPGMAKGGSGDVLTGLTAGLMARGYKACEAAMLGVWIHGFAGDILTDRCTAEAYSSSDMIEELYLGFKALYGAE